jgi:hypothetical protein
MSTVEFVLATLPISLNTCMMATDDSIISAARADLGDSLPEVGDISLQRRMVKSTANGYEAHRQNRRAW